MDRDFSGKVAIVTGGASGIGAAVAIELARRGAKVVVADLDTNGAERVVGDIMAQGGLAAPFQVNVADAIEVEARVALAERTDGGLHLAVNNAGIGGRSTNVVDYPLDGWRKACSTGAARTCGLLFFRYPPNYPYAHMRLALTAGPSMQASLSSPLIAGHSLALSLAMTFWRSWIMMAAGSPQARCGSRRMLSGWSWRSMFLTRQTARLRVNW